MLRQLAQLPARMDLVEAVYNVLVDAITDGSLTPGARITQEEIADQLNVSRSPVLQALRLLKKDGLIEDAPGRGVQVAPLQAEWVGHLYKVRGALDALAVQLAVEAGAKIDLAIIDRGLRASQSNDLKQVIDADMQFHNAIYLASGNPVIAESANRYWMHLRRVMGAVHRWTNQGTAIWEEHRNIALAINEGNLDLAVRLTNQHTESANERLLIRLRSMLETQGGAS